MSVIDILTRVDAICKKYDKYDVDEHRHLNVSADAFARLYNAVEADTDSALQWHSTEELAARTNLALALPDSTQAIGAPKQTGGWTTSVSPAEIKFDSDGRFESEHFQQTANSGENMTKALKRYQKVDKATSDLKNNNLRLKDSVNEVVVLSHLSSFQNFCINVILLCMILGIAAYLHNNDEGSTSSVLKKYNDTRAIVSARAVLLLSDSSVTFCEDQVAPDIGSQNSIAGIEVVTFRPISTTEIQFRGYITELIISVCQLLVRLDETLVLIPFSSLSLLSISHAVVRNRVQGR
ncbi:hypothetical protein C3L33_20179, partial [Rhododendron williamsianum]